MQNGIYATEQNAVKAESDNLMEVELFLVQRLNQIGVHLEEWIKRADQRCNHQHLLRLLNEREVLERILKDYRKRGPGMVSSPWFLSAG